MVKTPLLKANLLGFIATLLIGGGGIITSSAPASAMYNGASSSSAACEETQKRNQGAFAFPAQEFTGIRESLPVTLWADIHGLDNVAHLYTCHKEMVEWTREHLGIVEETPPVDMGESLVTTLAKYTSHMVGQEDFDANRVTQAIRRICRDTSRNAMPGASYDALYTLRCVHRVAELADRSLFFWRQ